SALFSAFQKGRFYPSKTIISSLATFSIRKVPSMMIDSQWLVETITVRMQCLKGAYDAVSWRFCTNSLLTGDEVKAQIDQSEFEYESWEHQSWREHCIVKRSNQMAAKFEMRQMDGIHPNMFIADVEFWSRQSSKEPRFRFRIFHNFPMP
ncbi:hypothetical protein PFISCL1PPCAC_633, partial [Pristionchus fissidentatus]